jgi:predicted DNA-binding transcriptional regulator AlpA
LPHDPLPNDPLSDELTIRQVTELTGLSFFLINKRSLAGHLPRPCVRGRRGRNGNCRWRKADVLQWMREEKQRRTGELFGLQRGLDRLSRELSA